jgi:hypothetical protein
MPTPSRSYQSILLDAIFHAQDKPLRESLKKRLEKLERREQLTQVSGIRDEALLDRLLELGITAETLAALELVPLVFVAWADGTVQAEERSVIVELAKAAGIEPKDGRYPLLEHWLKRRPSADMLEAWKGYVQELRRKLDAQDAEALRHELLDRTAKVAQAAGGFLGFGDKTSQAERAMLAKLEEAFS